ncbi:MAG: hypothetical protein ACLPR9_14925 [Acidimicrobiales bacterium]
MRHGVPTGGGAAPWADHGGVAGDQTEHRWVDAFPGVRRRGAAPLPSRGWN